MTHQQILDNHHIAHQTIDGRLLAADVWTGVDEQGNTISGQEWLDVTDYSRKDLMIWLGY